MLVNKNCLQCKKQFYVERKEINRGYGKFCSRECSYSFRKGKKKIIHTNCVCATCSNLFYRSPHRLKQSKTGLFFCSRHCKNLATRINTQYSQPDIMPPHFGTGKQNDSKIYRKICFENHSQKCILCGYNRIPQIIHVHHKDRNRENNSPDNLIPLCPTCHEEEHFKHSDGKWKQNKKSGD